MRIVVLNGSPKGDDSVTLQTVRYVSKQQEGHDWHYLNVAHRIAVLERDEQRWAEVIDEVRGADLVIWSCPVYYMLVCSQYKRFIELIGERGAADVFAGKAAAVVTTSIHFYDHTAHAYLRGIIDDLGMRYLGGLSADMDDLPTPAGQAAARRFGLDVLTAATEGRPAARQTAPLPGTVAAYAPGAPATRVDARGRRVLIVTDHHDANEPLAGMVRRMAEAWGDQAEVVNLNDLRISAGCQGCCHCAYDNQCVFEGKDDYIAFHREKLQRADIIVLAARIVDRNLSSRWRQFFDRSFFLNHAPHLIGRQFAVLLSGPAAHLPGLREQLEAWVQLQQANLVDIVSDENDGLDGLLDSVAQRLAQAAADSWVQPKTFLGVAAHKLFRDEVFGRLRWVFQADHRAYRRLGYYDFPQRDWKTRALNAVMMLLTRSARVRTEIQNRMRAEMVKGHQRAVEQG